MNKIASSLYENLTPRQRIIASIEAEARGDEDERQRLVSSCPKFTYRQSDIEFSQTMEKLLDLALAVECDLRGCALSFLFALRADAENALNLLTPYANIRAAWEITMTQMGMDADSMRKTGPPPSPVLELIEDLIPDPDRKGAEKLAAEMIELISAT